MRELVQQLGNSSYRLEIIQTELNDVSPLFCSNTSVLKCIEILLTDRNANAGCFIVSHFTRKSHAKAQRRKGKSLAVFFAPLRLCVRFLFETILNRRYRSAGLAPQRRDGVSFLRLRLAPEPLAHQDSAKAFGLEKHQRDSERPALAEP